MLDGWFKRKAGLKKAPSARIGDGTHDILAGIHYSPVGTALEPGMEGVQHQWGNDAVQVVVQCESVLRLRDCDDQTLEMVKRAVGREDVGMDITGNPDPDPRVAILKFLSPVFPNGTPEWYQPLN